MIFISSISCYMITEVKFQHGVADVQRYIDNVIKKVTGKIMGALKWVFTEMEKFILKKILNLVN